MEPVVKTIPRILARSRTSEAEGGQVVRLRLAFDQEITCSLERRRK